MLQPVEQPGQTLSSVLRYQTRLRIEEILRAERTDRAEIDDVARQFVVERFARKISISE